MTQLEFSSNSQKGFNVSRFKHSAIVIGIALGGLGLARSLTKMGVRYIVSTPI
jgi:hypothetical protein